jgi:hypothetical protein
MVQWVIFFSGNLVSGMVDLMHEYRAEKAMMALTRIDFYLLLFGQKSV